MKYFYLIFALGLILVFNGCMCNPEKPSVVSEIAAVLDPDSIMSDPDISKPELIEKFKTDSIRNMEAIRRDSIAKILEAKQRESKNSDKPCDEILRNYEQFLKKYSDGSNSEMLDKELKRWIEDVPFQSCLKSNPKLMLLKDSLENIYL